MRTDTCSAAQGWTAGGSAAKPPADQTGCTRMFGRQRFARASDWSAWDRSHDTRSTWDRSHDARSRGRRPPRGPPRRGDDRGREKSQKITPQTPPPSPLCGAFGATARTGRMNVRRGREGAHVRMFDMRPCARGVDRFARCEQSAAREGAPVRAVAPGVRPVARSELSHCDWWAWRTFGRRPGHTRTVARSTAGPGERAAATLNLPARHTFVPGVPMVARQRSHVRPPGTPGRNIRHVHRARRKKSVPHSGPPQGGP